MNTHNWNLLVAIMALFLSISNFVCQDWTAGCLLLVIVAAEIEIFFLKKSIGLLTDTETNQSQNRQ